MINLRVIIIIIITAKNTQNAIEVLFLYTHSQNTWTLITDV